MNPPINPPSVQSAFDNIWGSKAPAQGSASTSRANEIRALAKQSQPQPASVQEQGIGARITSDVKSTGADVSNAIQGQGQYANDNPVTRGFEAASSAAGGVGKVASEVLPAPVRNAVGAVGNAAGGVVNWLGDKLGSTKLAQDFVTNHPDAANTLEQMTKVGSSAGNIAGSILATDAGAKAGNFVADKASGIASKVPDMANTIKEGVVGTPEEIAAKNLQKTVDIVAPKMSASETADALAQGRGQGGGLLSKTKIAPDARTLDIAKATQDIVKKGATGAENINNVRTALSTEAENLKNQIQSVDHPYVYKELNSVIKNVERPAMLKSANLEKVFTQVQNKAMEIAKSTGGKISDLLDARKGFDTYVQKEFPNLYNSDTLTPMKTAIKNIRGAMNDFIEKNLPENNNFKESLKKQSLFYDAIDNIASKSVEETKSTGLQRVAKTIKKHPVISTLGAIEANNILKKTTGLGF